MHFPFSLAEVLILLLITATTRGTASSSPVACFSPKAGLACSVVGPYNITVKCDLPSNRELFSNYVEYHPGCTIVEDKKLYQPLKRICLAKKVPSTLYYLSPSPPIECLCVSARCLYRAYWSRELIAISVSIPATTPPTTTPPPEDLKCKVCQGRAQCHTLPSRDLNCTIPEETNCAEETVDSTTTQCTITVELFLDNVTSEDIHFQAGTEAIEKSSNLPFEVRSNNSERAIFINRCQQNKNEACNNNITVPAPYLKSLRSNASGLVCYNCSSNAFNCKPDTNSSCRVPEDKCTQIMAKPGYSCSLGVTVFKGISSAFIAEQRMRTSADPADSPICTAQVEGVLMDSNLLIFSCFCNTDLCNGIITVPKQDR